MSIQVSYVNAQENPGILMDEVTDNREPVIIKRRGPEDVALIAASDLSSMEGTIHSLISLKTEKRPLPAVERAQSRTQEPESIENFLFL
jgi:antitoxin YefM